MLIPLAVRTSRSSVLSVIICFIVVWFLITATKLQPFFLFANFFLTFLYKMFRERYYKSFSVRMKIITYNTVITFCHLVEVAIFAVGDFFSLFSIAVFNIPISHRIIILLFLLQSYCFFRYFQIFLTFFYWSRADLPTIAKFILSYSLFRWSCVPVVLFRSCAGRMPVLVVCPVSLNHTRVHIHARTRIFKR